MATNLRLQVCNNYFHEVEAVINQEKFPNVTVQTYPPVCLHPQATQRILEQVLTKSTADEDHILLSGGCVLGNKIDLSCVDMQQTQTQGEISCYGCCLHMLASPELIGHFSQHGEYLVTPGWLSSWRSTLNHWGFDQANALSFFQESCSRLVLIDTCTDPKSVQNLTEFAEYVGLPTQVVPVGLDHFRLLISKVVTEWQIKQNNKLTKFSQDQGNQQLANYALAFDLLANLTRIMTEREVIQEIEHIFSMLFAPQNTTYISLVEGNLQECFSAGTPPDHVHDLCEWAAASDEGYYWLEMQNGFYLRISYQSKTLGVVKIDRVAFPQHIQEYLNMGLVLAPLCALAISNARAYQELEENQVKFRHLATVDPLTGLANRRHFMEVVEAELKRARRYKHPLSIITLDIDYFKSVNDNYGHPVGDRVLVEVSNLLTRETRETDIRSRMGGDEFQIMLSEANMSTAKSIAERICRSIADLVILVGDVAIEISASLGVASLDDSCLDLEDLLYRCDQALYQAKNSGRGLTVFWHKDQ